MYAEMRIIIGLVVSLTLVLYLTPVGGRRVKKTCDPKAIPNTIANCNQQPTANQRYRKGTVCIFQCVTGCIRLQGGGKRTCKVRGRTKWWKGGRGLKCECNPCERAPGLPEGSTSDCYPAQPPYPAGHVCTFTCPDGYNQISRDGRKLCKNGIWRGDDVVCEETDECASDPCQNGATCEDGVNGYTCTCVPGYEGVHCETDTDECASDPCQYGGTCVDGVNGYTCTCADGYEGVHCETNTDECASDPCQYGGTCVDGVNGYTCTCADGYEGVHCETNTDECASEPCQNGGTCEDEVNGYTCTCADGYEGVHCETDTDECASGPCQNGGICADLVNGHTCTCAAGFAGVHCETVACATRTDPPEAERGGIFCSNSGPPYPLGTICAHSCNNEEGFFRKSGDEGRTCQEGRVWDGDDLVCVASCLVWPLYGPSADENYTESFCVNYDVLLPEIKILTRTFYRSLAELGLSNVLTDLEQLRDVGLIPFAGELGPITGGDDRDKTTHIANISSTTRQTTQVTTFPTTFQPTTRVTTDYYTDPTAGCAARTDPPVAQRGFIVCDNPGPPYPIGTLCSHSCDNLGGFNFLSGDARRTCQVGGIWGGADVVCSVPRVRRRREAISTHWSRIGNVTSLVYDADSGPNEQMVSFAAPALETLGENDTLLGPLRNLTEDVEGFPDNYPDTTAEAMPTLVQDFHNMIASLNCTDCDLRGPDDVVQLDNHWYIIYRPAIEYNPGGMKRGIRFRILVQAWRGFRVFIRCFIY
ncbi:uncharacterized protein [Branchiostoma lanceolatum]|uniref:uncharacterized protein isoform X2 n=1 Tax=Branchiostoma lanceolatum TaxID=7740 RepID=UPI0034518670